MQNVDQLHAQDYHQNVIEPQATEYHTKSTHTYNCESGLAKVCCTKAAPAHTAGHIQMAWTEESTLATFFFLKCATGSPHCCSKKRSESSDKWHRQIAMRLPTLNR